MKKNIIKDWSNFDTSKEISHGLDVLLNTSMKKSAENFNKKVVAMQESFLQSNFCKFEERRIKQIRYYLKTVLYKYLLVNLSLEQLWALSEVKNTNLSNVLENSMTTLKTSDDEILLIAFAFEGVLFQAMACLEFYLLYLSFFLELKPVDYRGKITKEKFLKELDKIPKEKKTQKTMNIEDYLIRKIFGKDEDDLWHKNNWGNLLISLRNKIAHRDRVRPSFNSDDVMIDGKHSDWPTINKITYERFTQSLSNGIFCMIKNLSQILYKTE